MRKSLYAILEVPENSNIQEIKKSYRRLAKKYHPDINKTPEAEEKFKEINSAYEILGDKEKKEKYDRYGDNVFGGQNFHDFSTQNSNFEFNINDFFASMFEESNNNPFQDMFTSMNLDIEYSVDISATTALNGGSITLNIENKTLKIKIPKNIKIGDKIRLKGKGKSINGETGDLYLFPNIISDDNYIIDGINIIEKRNITLKEAIFGTSLKISIKDENINIKVPEGIQSGTRIRVKNKGLNSKKTNKTGDLYIEINVLIPKGSSLPKEVSEILQTNLKDSL